VWYSLDPTRILKRIAKGVHYLISVKVLNSKGNGWVSDIRKGIEYVIRQDHASNPDTPAVINMSMGAEGVPQMWDRAIHTAVRADIFVVVAVGNKNEDACNYSPAVSP
jgi:cerevisin